MRAPDQPSIQAMRSELERGAPALIAALFGVTCGVVGVFYYSIGLFIKPLEAEFGWSRGTLSLVPSITGLCLAAFSPLIGLAVDRFGIRPVAILSMGALAVGFWLLGNIQGALIPYLLTITATVIAGSGASPVAYSKLVNLWFDKARGLALGLTLAGTGVAGTLLPYFLVPYIAHAGWRAGYHALALVVLATLPVIVLFARAPKDGHDETKSVPQDSGLTLMQAIRTRSFWTIGAMFICAAVAVGGVIVHFVPMLRDAGLTPQRAAGLASIIGLAVIAGRIVSGALIDRIFAPYVAAAIFALAALGCFALAFGGVAYAPLAATLIGLAIGAEVDMVGYLTARYFGLKSCGKIYGWLYAFFMAGTAIGPFIAGQFFDRFGNYTNALILFGGALALAVPLALSLKPFPHWQSSTAIPSPT